MARLLLGVCGGIAAYRSLELIRAATKSGHAVRAVVTPTAERFVGRASFEALTGAPVLGDEFERDPARGVFPDQVPPDHAPISHLELVANADVLLVAPATANTIAKLATGAADNLLTACALAARCPVAVAPAMNDHMYRHPATRANLQLLRERGVTVIEPDTGALASRGEWGMGRLRDPAELLAAFEALVPAREDAAPGATAAPGALAGLRVLVTAGGTREPIDAVRYVGNRSSGRMGLELAGEAARRGARVTCVAANVALERPGGVEYVDVETAAELKEACERRFDACEVLLMSAAVADFRPVGPAAGKIKKSGREGLSLALEATDDVLSSLAARRHEGQTLVGFAAEHGGDGREQARSKLAAKSLDAVVLNDVSAPGVGFDSPDNEVVIVTTEGERAVPRMPKCAIAGAVLDAVAQLRADAGIGAAPRS